MSQRNDRLVWVKQVPKLRRLKDGATIAVHANGRTFKVAKLSFRPKAADLYLSLPYFKARSFRCGIYDIASGAGDDAALTLDFNSLDSVDDSVKFSYHESGQLNLKVRGWQPGNRYTSMRGLPLAQLSGEHIFTIECEGFEAFEESTKTDLQSPQYIPIAFPDPIERIKITGYAGFAQDQVISKYSSNLGAPFLQRRIIIPPSEIIEFRRPTLFAPLHMAIYVFGGTSLHVGLPEPYMFAFFGLRKDSNGIKTLALHSSIPSTH